MKGLEWDFSRPHSAVIGDHDVPLRSSHLTGRRIALLVCGGIAALRTPLLARALRRRGATVVAFASEEALRYVGREALEWATCHPVVTALTWRAEHLSDDTPFDAWLVAPATYNTIGKVAAGVADTVVTAALASALGRAARGQTCILMVPTMHGSMHQAILEENVCRLTQAGVRFLAPRDEYGKHNLPEDETLVAGVCRALAPAGLRERRILVTGGSIPTPQPDGRRVLRPAPFPAVAVAEDLALSGSDVALIVGEGAGAVPAWLPFRTAASPEAYRGLVLEELAQGLDAAVLGAVETDSEDDLGEALRAAAPAMALLLPSLPSDRGEEGSVEQAASLLEELRGQLARFD